jgi:legumain
MKSLSLLSLFFFITLSESLQVEAIPHEARKKDPWVLLVAGSHGYRDYDFEANTCHAYHLVRSHGVPDERIIIMMYDDVANSPRNPTPGVLINWPNGTNVYEGCKDRIDYREHDVTPETFRKVLSGDEELEKQGKRVIKGTSKDNIFVYLTGNV